MFQDHDDTKDRDNELGPSLTKLLAGFSNSEGVHPNLHSKEQKTDKMGVFHQNLTLVKRFIAFLQSMDQWVYNQPEQHISQRPEPITLEQAHKLAVDFAKTQQERD